MAKRPLKTAEFRKIYREGSKFTCPLFAAFYCRAGAGEGTRVGYTTPRALGRAVVRNRIRRRLREAMRLEWPAADPGFAIVLNPRRAALQAEFASLRAEAARLFGLLGRGSA